MYLAKNKHHNQRLIKYLFQKAYPNGCTIYDLINDNVISGTQLSEIAVSKSSGIKIDNIGIGMDLIDGSDIKTTTVGEKPTKTWLVKDKKKTNCFNISIRHQAVVTDICSKIGKLRVIAYNPFYDKWHFFIFPNNIFQKLKQITISFDKNTGVVKGMYKEFECNSWEEMCIK